MSAIAVPHDQVPDEDSNADSPDLFARLPHDLAVHLLHAAGGPPALQDTRSTSTAWKGALDSLVSSASCSLLSSTAHSSANICDVLLHLPKLHTVDFSNCCQPLPPGRLEHILCDLSKLTGLRTLKLSTWSMALFEPPTQQDQLQLQEPTMLYSSSSSSSTSSSNPSASSNNSSSNPSSSVPSTSSSSGGVTINPSSSVASAAQQQAPPAAPPPPALTATTAPQYDITLPHQIAGLRNLQNLILMPCPEVNPPCPQRLELPACLMSMPHLSSLELHGFLPPVHHLRGLKHLQHLSITTPQVHTEAGTPAGSERWQQHVAAIRAASAAVQTLQTLTSLHVQLSSGTGGYILNHAAFMASLECGELLELLSTDAAPFAASTAIVTSSWPAAAAVASPAATTGAAAATEQAAVASPAAATSSTPRSSRATAQAAAAQAAAVARHTPRPACKLRQLHITHSGGLHHLPAKFAAAAACSGLRELDLSHTRLTGDAAGVLGGLGLLTNLCLVEAGVQELPACWAGLTNLQVLNLSGNRLSALPPFFSCLRGLQQLVLASTDLLLLPGFVSSLNCLTHLNLASNKLQELPTELCSCEGLMHLDVSKNRLLALPEGFSALSHITQLSLTGNHLEVLPSGLHALRHLSSLGLALNYYKAWRPAQQCFASLASTLQDLELQHTAMVMDDAAGFLAAVGQLTALTRLAAGSNQLNDLPASWQQLKQLQVLQLSHNAMEALPIGLLCLTSLTYLDVSYNRLVALPFWIGSSKLQRLKRLNLAKNHLTTLPVEMSGLSRLTQLQLQGNNLAAVPPCLGCLHCLRLLNIGGNYKLKEGGLGGQLAALGSLRDVVLPFRLDRAAQELRAAGKAVTLD